jgi:hypothetical protein
MMTILTVVGARGGQAASTVAAALALVAAEQMRTELETHDLRSAAALLGLSDTDVTDVAVTARLSLHAEGHDRVRRAPVVIRDAGCLGAAGQGTTLVVLRGPCHVALRAMVDQHDRAPAGVVLVAEPGRSLDARDVEDVTGLPVVATVSASSRVARAIDAGLLVSRLPQLREFASLRRYVSDVIASAGVVDSSLVAEPVTPSRARETVSWIATDLPVALSATS